MNTTHPDTRLIGYWLRATDHLISRSFAEAFAEEGVTRREWMLLNVIDGSVDAPGLADRLKRGGKKLRALEDRGWIESSDDGWILTDDGRAAKERLSEIVDGIRARLVDAVGPDDFATTLASLEAIARELGWDENAPDEFDRPRRFGFGFDPGPRHGFGPGPRFGRGFGPWARFDEEGHPFAGRSHHDHEHGHGCPAHDAHGHDHRHGDHGHAGRHGRHGQRHARRHAERAFERGFDAGFARGRDAREADHAASPDPSGAHEG